MKNTYIVIFNDGYGSYFDGDTMAFTDEETANRYANKMNIELANASGCRVQDLGDTYEVYEIPFLDF